MSEITFDDVCDAYRKLKSYVYYDKHTLLSLRRDIAKYEEAGNSLEEMANILQEKLKTFFESLFVKRDSKYFERDLIQLAISAIPKKYDNSDPDEGFSYLSNDHLEREYKVNRYSFYAKASVEIHLITILWLKKLGYKLEKDLGEYCYGNRLALYKGKLILGPTLYRPYVGQYSRWWKNGLHKAKEEVKSGHGVVLINLDFKDFYHSVRIDFQELGECLKIDSESEQLRWLHELFYRIHRRYGEKFEGLGYQFDPVDVEYSYSVSEENLPLPIGLLSSYILANWYLKDFDKKVFDHARPLYYGRYVDDLFFVFRHSTDATEWHYQKDTNQNTLPKKKRAKERIDDFFKLVFSKVIFPDPRSEKKKTTYRITQDGDLVKYKRICLQQDKLLFYDIFPNEAESVLDHFIREQKERSSEFRFLTDEAADSTDHLDGEAFDLSFSGTSQFSHLRSVQLNNYRLSVYLSKQIARSIRGNNKGDTILASQILRLFRGQDCLAYSFLWEKICTYFLVNGEKECLLSFFKHALEQILRIRVDEKYESNEKLDHTTTPLESMSLHHELIFQLKTAIEMAVNLHPSFLNNKLLREFHRIIDTMKISYYDTIKFYAKLPDIRARWQCELVFAHFPKSNGLTGPLFDKTIYRRSLLIRHYLVYHALINYTDCAWRKEFAVYDPEILTAFEDLTEIDLPVKAISILSPRKIKFWEACWLTLYTKMLLFQKEACLNTKRMMSDFLKAVSGHDDTSGYLEQAFQFYFDINYLHPDLHADTFKNKVRERFFASGYIDSIESEIEAPHTVSECCPPRKSDCGKNYETAEIIINNSKKGENGFHVALVNMIVNEKELLDRIDGKPTPTLTVKNLNTVLDFVERERGHCDLFILPELALPVSTVPLFIDQCVRKQFGCISGVGHWTIGKKSFNLIMSILPVRYGTIKDAVPIMRLKNHYAPLIEEEVITNHKGYVIPKPNPYRYDLIKWRSVYFAPYYCYELSDTSHRIAFTGKLDMLVAAIWNPDTQYYNSIVESTSREVHCYFIQANTAQYGDSRVTQPANFERRNLLQIKGGENIAVLTVRLDIEKLREFQMLQPSGQKEKNRDKKSFKPTPPDFNRDFVQIRINQESFSGINTINSLENDFSETTDNHFDDSINNEREIQDPEPETH